MIMYSCLASDDGVCRDDLKAKRKFCTHDLALKY